MRDVTTTTLVGVLVVLVIVMGLFFAFSANSTQQQLLSITNFDECVEAGFPVMESYPEQCRTSDGRTFVNERQTLPQELYDDVSSNGCAVAGCSGQLCVAAEKASEVVTTCEFRAEYACYREASCEPQTNGKCGWTQTSELQKCLANPPAVDGNIEAIY